MIKISNVYLAGFEPAIRGMRNPWLSWDKSDSFKITDPQYGDGSNPIIPPAEILAATHGFIIGPNDHDLAMRLCRRGSDEAKFRRMIFMWFDMDAPVYFWHDFDTYQVATAKNSEGQTRQIIDHAFTREDFSCDMLSNNGLYELDRKIARLNELRDTYLADRTRENLYQIVQEIPKSHNQLRTICINYETAHGMYRARHNHTYQEFRDLCKFFESLPYSEFITLE